MFCATHQSTHVCPAGDRVLCFECYRSERDRRRAGLAEVAALRSISNPFGITLTVKQIAHRAIMLDNLRRTAADGRSGSS